MLHCEGKPLHTTIDLFIGHKALLSRADKALLRVRKYRPEIGLTPGLSNIGLLDKTAARPDLPPGSAG